MMTIQRREGSASKRRRGSVTPVLGVLAAMLMVAGLCSTAFASTRSVASVSSTPKAATGGVITEQDYYSAGDNSEMVAFIKQFQAQNPGFTVKRDVVASTSMESQELVEAAAGQLPDLLMMDNPWVGGLAAAGDLVPLAQPRGNSGGEFPRDAIRYRFREQLPRPVLQQEAAQSGGCDTSDDLG